ncbi:HTH-type transcriptional activator AaeR [Pseudomonas sp. FW306-02-F02-AA]|uniref:LysR family transcriptional regulator n=1 Tax=Pseudomonas fluorescens TaxID=294 RepID=A0A0N7H0H4_PSEFL|nr:MULTISPECIES: LysR family transcriptional regulator [Pseudomonas]ALI03148.1 LysR family transcriptional regulator [Pseudomonas fluorescens]PMZ01014.1 HTH-type transcriptional activator AaeR [Pseudomonas sp. FW306-02-F02-AB]PMZ06844.1 HTH-type transcriptional activator AaeR [Pseudomonas sp. FW306-02-H06C]PMZ12811.1 HTH-type transcriptional activator AaeR [Pseudomonas sp. FW306-02-F02-AA]PMZ18701.1 HTH-type transcriptional activator AaeR [Pseudomonas sp. FW306-02-F08-AA]
MDKLNAMAVFVRVVERGSFSAVARELQTSQPTISKILRALETELGGKLIARSTRQLSLTDEGQRYYNECRQILVAVDSAEHSFQSGREAVAGPLRVGSSVSFGRLQIAARLPDFLERYPHVEIDLQLSDQNQDLVSEGLDVTLRIGELSDSGLIARQIGTTHRVTVASPNYLARHGQPHTPEELSQHNCLLFNLLSSQNQWIYEKNAQRYNVRIKGNAQSNNSEAIREMVLGGLGIALSPVWLFSEDLKAGRVIAILQDYRAQSLPIHAVFPANRRQSARVKAFVDYMSEAFAHAPELAPPSED